MLEDEMLRDDGVRNYEFVVRTIATVGNYGVFLSSIMKCKLVCRMMHEQGTDGQHPA